MDFCVWRAMVCGDFAPLLDVLTRHNVVRKGWRQEVSCTQHFARPVDGVDPLMAACRHGRVDIVRLVLDLGAFPWVQVHVGLQLLRDAVQTPAGDTAYSFIALAPEESRAAVKAAIEWDSSTE